jgi:hypothetical protein
MAEGMTGNDLTKDIMSCTPQIGKVEQQLDKVIADIHAHSYLTATEDMPAVIESVIDVVTTCDSSKDMVLFAHDLEAV